MSFTDRSDAFATPANEQICFHISESSTTSEGSTSSFECEDVAVPTSDMAYLDTRESSVDLSNALAPIDTTQPTALPTNFAPSIDDSQFSADLSEEEWPSDTDDSTDHDAKVLTPEELDKRRKDELAMPPPPRPRGRKCITCDKWHEHRTNCERHATTLCLSCWTLYITNEISLNLNPCICPFPSCGAAIPADAITTRMQQQREKLIQLRQTPAYYRRLKNSCGAIRAWAEGQELMEQRQQRMKTKYFVNLRSAIRAWAENQKPLQIPENELEDECDTCPIWRLHAIHHERKQDKRRAPAREAREKAEEASRRMRGRAPSPPPSSARQAWQLMSKAAAAPSSGKGLRRLGDLRASTTSWTPYFPAAVSCGRSRREEARKRKAAGPLTDECRLKKRKRDDDEEVLRSIDAGITPEDEYWLPHTQTGQSPFALAFVRAMSVPIGG